ncbi:MAG TPA: FAD-dependent monooxygenase [Stellaceae bacterium]|nr:FAD-dependent monooxygenase [Stellaceae bacterium]
MAHGRALIVGGSVGGLFAAHFLRAAGWDAVVVERSDGELADRGASIGTREELFDALRCIGISLDPSAGVAARSRICLDDKGSIIEELPIASVSSAWDRIYRPLRAALPASCYRAGLRVERVEPRPNGVTAIFADGTRGEADLLIAADGIHSTVRGQLMPEAAARYAGYVAWRGVIEESALTREEHELLFGRMCFCLPEGELLLAMGMPGRDDDTRPGKRRYYWIWFRAADRERGLPLLCTDESGRCHGASIPPPLVRGEVLADLRRAAEARFAPPLAAIIRRTAQPFPHGIFDFESSRLVFGRVAVLGDAAFVARPHVGAGVTKAALDAQCLADALAAGGDIAAALARYEGERRAFGQALVARGRYLGAYLEAHSKAPDRFAARAREPAAVLAEYGSAGRSR